MGKRTKAKVIESRGNFNLLEVPPCFQHVYYGRKSFYLPMPWMYFVLHHYGKAYHLEAIWARPKPMNLAKGDTMVDFMALPNLYGSKPCMRHHGKSNPASDTEGMNQTLMSWWDAGFNTDGELARHPVWRWLSDQAGAARTSRAKVFAHWETLDTKAICAAPWKPNRDPFVSLLALNSGNYIPRQLAP